MPVSPTHDINSTCSCINCQRIDILWGDPLMNSWEHRFIDNLSHWGWIHDYTPKQTTKLDQVFTRIRAIRLLS